MAAITWPYDLCTILRDGYTETVDENVRRTQLEDGAVSQARTASRDFRVRRLSVLVTDSNATAFLKWTSDNANAWFNYTDLDGQQREVRLRGGNSTVQLVRQAGRRLNGERFGRAEIEIEGY